MERNFLLTVAYDGTPFAGWQLQPDVPTVQGTLEEALEAVCNTKIRVNGTSRTDAGVHAYGQRVGFSGDFGIPTDKLALAVNHVLAGMAKGKSPVGSIVITKVEEKPIGFRLRADSKGKKYIYKIKNTADVDLFQRNYCYYIKKPLDVEAMKEAAKFIVGVHDFKCFQAAGGAKRATTIRNIYDLKIDVSGENITLQIDGNGFLYNMVRIITGTLVDVGRGRFVPKDVEKIILDGDRQKAGHTAPPQGLYLAEVYY
ncbi:MAG: tRNA pseudouridine(38-40) synthase TruA [Anaerovoracaceae bacterium]